MMIREMAETDIRNMIQHSPMGRLAYIHGNRPVIVPMSFRFSGGALYSFTTAGRKTEALRGNDAVCVLFDNIVSRTQWRTVVVHGRYREIAGEDECEAIVKLLADEPLWWEPGYTRTITSEGGERRLEPVFFRVDIESATGHQAV